MREIIRIICLILAIVAIWAQREGQKRDDMYSYLSAGQLWIACMIGLI